MPGEWEYEKLKQVVNISKGKIVPNFHQPISGSLPYIGASAFESPTSTWTASEGGVIAKPSDVLMLWDGERSGLVTTGLSGVISSTVARLRPNIGWSSLYLAHFLKSRFDFIQSRRTGTGVPHVPKDLGDILNVPKPPLPEQQRIAQILDTLDRTIEGTQRIIEKLQATRQGLLHDLLTRGLDEHGQLRDPERNPEQFKETELGKLPRAWEIGRVEDFGEVRLGRQRSPQHQSGRYTTPYLRVANVFDGWIDYSDVLEMDFTPSEKTVYGLLPGDILLNEGQSLNLVGRPAMYEGEPGKFCYQNTLVRFRCGRQLVPSYTLSTFKRYLDTGVFQTIAKQTTSIAHLGADRFAKLLIAVPPLREQKAAVSLLDAASKKIVGEQRRLDKLQALKRGLMDDLLTGRVRVPLSEAER